MEHPDKDVYPPVTGQPPPNGTYDKKCYDIDECAFDQCNGPQQLCYNTVGSYDCLCANGYEPQTICMWEEFDNATCLEICFDINECELDYPCVVTEFGSDECINTVSYRLFHTVGNTVLFRKEATIATVGLDTSTIGTSRIT